MCLHLSRVGFSDLCHCCPIGSARQFYATVVEMSVSLPFYRSCSVWLQMPRPPQFVEHRENTKRQMLWIKAFLVNTRSTGLSGGKWFLMNFIIPTDFGVICTYDQAFILDQRQVQWKKKVHDLDANLFSPSEVLRSSQSILKISLSVWDFIIHRGRRKHGRTNCLISACSLNCKVKRTGLLLIPQSVNYPHGCFHPRLN